MLLDLVAVPPDQLRGLLDVAERLEAALADLERHQRGQIEEPVLHHVGHVAKDPDALLPAHPLPLERERLRGLHRILDVLRRRLREATDDQVRVDRRGLLVLLVGPALLTVDDEGPLLAELGTGALHRLVVVALQVLVVRGQGGVGDPELLGHRTLLLCSSGFCWPGLSWLGGAMVSPTALPEHGVGGARPDPRISGRNRRFRRRPGVCSGSLR